MDVTNASPEREILNKPGASELLQVKGRTLDEWMRKKIVPFAKLPSGAVRFRRSQLLAFIAKYEVGQ
jgi:predicted site-specific integrase-resolvase